MWGVTAPTKLLCIMEKIPNQKEEWFLHFLDRFFVHAMYWTIIALMFHFAKW